MPSAVAWKTPVSSSSRVRALATSAILARTANFCLGMNPGEAGSKPHGPSSTAYNRSPGKAFPAWSCASLTFSGENPLIGCRKSAAMEAVMALPCPTGWLNTSVRRGWL